MKPNSYYRALTPEQIHALPMEERLEVARKEINGACLWVLVSLVSSPLALVLLWICGR